MNALVYYLPGQGEAFAGSLSRSILGSVRRLFVVLIFNVFASVQAQVSQDREAWEYLLPAITASNVGTTDQFGAAIAISADGMVMAVGAPFEDAEGDALNNSGAVYVYRRGSDGWVQEAVLRSTVENREDDRFGASVALSDDGGLLAAGAPFEGGTNASGRAGGGMVHVFEYNAGSGDWREATAPFRGSNTVVSAEASANGRIDQFGASVDVSGDGRVLIVGAPNEDGDANSMGGAANSNDGATGSGAAYVFTRNGSAWVQQGYLKASNVGVFDNFGRSVAVNRVGDVAVVGAPLEDGVTGGLAAQSGAVYVFRRTGVVWSPGGVLVRASDGAAGDRLGASVSLNDAGDVLAAGAPTKNGGAGAAYVLRYNGTRWVEETAITAAEVTGSGGDLGRHIALDGTGGVLAVGAPLEDAAEDNSGAVYLFRSDGDSEWSEEAYIKAPNSDVQADARLGRVALGGGGTLLVMGAPNNDVSRFSDSVQTVFFDAGTAYVLAGLVPVTLVVVPEAIMQQVPIVPGELITVTASLMRSLPEAVTLSVSVTGPGGTEEPELTIAVPPYSTQAGTTFIPDREGSFELVLRSGVSLLDTAAAMATVAVSLRDFTVSFDREAITLSRVTDKLVADIKVGVNQPLRGSERIDVTLTSSQLELRPDALTFSKDRPQNQPAQMTVDNTVQMDTIVLAVNNDLTTNVGNVATGIDTLRVEVERRLQGVVFLEGFTEVDEITPPAGEVTVTVGMDSPLQTGESVGLVLGLNGAGFDLLSESELTLNAMNSTAQVVMFINDPNVSGTLDVTATPVGLDLDDLDAQLTISPRPAESVKLMVTPELLALVPGGSGGVTLTTRPLLGQEQTLDLTLSVEASGSLDVPSPVALSSGTRTRTVTVTAGRNTGIFAVTITAAENDLGVDQAGFLYAGVSDGIWRHRFYVKASNTGEGDQFGTSVAVSADGDVLAVGASFEDGADDGSEDEAGAVYVFRRNTEGVWSQEELLTAGTGQAGAHFGASVSLNADGTVLAAGADRENGRLGAVYVFEYNGAWSSPARLSALNAVDGADDDFGASVALNGAGDVLVVGAPREDGNANSMGGAANSNDAASGSGAAYVFTRNGSAWVQQGYLKASNVGAFDNFGRSVAVNRVGDVAAVGAPLEDGVTGSSSAQFGAVYVFRRNAEGVWNEGELLRASDGAAGDRLGASVALNGAGDVLAAGAPTKNGGAGAAYVLRYNGTRWVEETAITVAEVTGSGGDLGRHIALDGTGGALAAGAPMEDMAEDNSGAVYLFRPDGDGEWYEEMYVKASNAGAGDRFGRVALSGDGTLLAVGAPFEDGSATGVSSLVDEENDEGAENSGAVCLLEMNRESVLLAVSPVHAEMNEPLTVTAILSSVLPTDVTLVVSVMPPGFVTEPTSISITVVMGEMSGSATFTPSVRGIWGLAVRSGDSPLLDVDGAVANVDVGGVGPDQPPQIVPGVIGAIPVFSDDLEAGVFIDPAVRVTDSDEDVQPGGAAIGRVEIRVDDGGSGDLRNPLLSISVNGVRTTASDTQLDFTPPDVLTATRAQTLLQSLMVGLAVDDPPAFDKPPADATITVTLVVVRGGSDQARVTQSYRVTVTERNMPPEILLEHSELSFAEDSVDAVTVGLTVTNGPGESGVPTVRAAIEGVLPGDSVEVSTTALTITNIPEHLNGLSTVTLTVTETESEPGQNALAVTTQVAVMIVAVNDAPQIRASPQGDGETLILLAGTSGGVMAVLSDVDVTQRNESLFAQTNDELVLSLEDGAGNRLPEGALSLGLMDNFVQGDIVRLNETAVAMAEGLDTTRTTLTFTQSLTAAEVAFLIGVFEVRTALSATEGVYRLSIELTTGVNEEGRQGDDRRTGAASVPVEVASASVDAVLQVDRDQEPLTVGVNGAQRSVTVTTRQPLLGVQSAVLTLSVDGVSGVSLSSTQVMLSGLSQTATVNMIAERSAAAGTAELRVTDVTSNFVTVNFEGVSASVAVEPLQVELQFADELENPLEQIVLPPGEDLTVNLQALPMLVGGEMITVSLIENDAENRIMVTPASGTLSASANSIPVTITTSAEATPGTVRVTLTESGRDNLDNARITVSALLVNVLPPTRIRFVPARSLAMRAGETQDVIVTTEPPLAPGQSATLRLTVGGAGLSFIEGEARPLSPEEVVLIREVTLSGVSTQQTVMIAGSRPGVSGTLSATVLDSDVIIRPARAPTELPITVGNGESGGVIFYTPSAVILEQGTTRLVTMTIYPSLGSGQSVSVSEFLLSGDLNSHMRENSACLGVLPGACMNLPLLGEVLVAFDENTSSVQTVIGALAGAPIRDGMKAETSELVIGGVNTLGIRGIEEGRLPLTIQRALPRIHPPPTAPLAVSQSQLQDGTPLASSLTLTYTGAPDAQIVHGFVVTLAPGSNGDLDGASFDLDDFAGTTSSGGVAGDFVSTYTSTSILSVGMAESLLQSLELTLPTLNPPETATVTVTLLLFADDLREEVGVEYALDVTDENDPPMIVVPQRLEPAGHGSPVPLTAVTLSDPDISDGGVFVQSGDILVLTITDSDGGDIADDALFIDLSRVTPGVVTTEGEGTRTTLTFTRQQTVDDVEMLFAQIAVEATAQAIAGDYELRITLKTAPNDASVKGNTQTTEANALLVVGLSSITIRFTGDTPLSVVSGGSISATLTATLPFTGTRTATVTLTPTGGLTVTPERITFMDGVTTVPLTITASYGSRSAEIRLELMGQAQEVTLGAPLAVTVAPRTVNLSLSPVPDLLEDGSARVTVGTVSVLRGTEEIVAGLSVSPPNLLEVTPATVALTSTTTQREVIVTAGSVTDVTAATLSVRGESERNVISGANSLDINVLPRVAVSFSTPSVVVTAGGETVAITLNVEPALMIGDRREQVRLNAGDGGVVVTPGVLTLTPDSGSRVEITVNAPPGTTASSTLQISLEALSDGVEVGSPLTVEVEARRVAVRFTDFEGDLLNSGTLSLVSRRSTEVRLSSPDLQAGESLMVELRSEDTGVVSLSSSSITLRSGEAVPLQITAERVGAVPVEIIARAGNGRGIRSSTATFEVAVTPRAVALMLEGVPASLEMGLAANVTVSTTPALVMGEEVMLTLNENVNLEFVPPSVTLSGNAQSEIVTMSATGEPGTFEVSVTPSNLQNVRMAESRFSVTIDEVIVTVEFTRTMLTLTRERSSETITVTTNPLLRGIQELVVTLEASNGLSLSTNTVVLTSGDQRRALVVEAGEGSDRDGTATVSISDTRAMHVTPAEQHSVLNVVISLMRQLELNIRVFLEGALQ